MTADGKWLTPPTPPPHRCILPINITNRVKGDIWECHCGEQWRYKGTYWSSYYGYEGGYEDSWTNLKEEAERKKKEEEKRARKAAAPWFMRPFVR